MNNCPHYCGGKLIGKAPNRICSSLGCGGYEVDTTNPASYDVPLSKRKREERLNKPSS